MSINIKWPTEEGTKEASLPLSQLGGINGLKQQLLKHLGESSVGPGFMLTDTLKDITNDEDVARLRDGATLVVAQNKDGILAGPARERISFQPHPRTLTMAGDYEYFAAQGRHPFVYALAEFIDNSLRATRNNAPNPRTITIAIHTTGSGDAQKGLVCITDNGCGMTKHELNDWAVMNYSMEERGAAPKEPESVGRGAGTCTGAGRFLTGNLSFFGVGSKNAAFFIGSCVKVVTRKAEERYVHELCLAAEDLEQRYRNGESVYEGDMVHRNPGDESTLSRVEQTFDAARAWVREESSAQGGAFTRVIIGDLKPEILQQLTADFDGGQLCRELAHLYHYYLHGEKGNRGAAAATEPAPAGPGTASPPAGMLPNGEPVPLITLRHAADTRLLWERRLTDVEDDFETQMLRGQKAELQFTLNVPDRGTVIGVLYYFPYENDRETVPREEGIAPPASVFGAPGAGLTQAGGPGATQFGATRATQGGHHSGSSQEGVSDDEDGAPGAWRAPIFEAFWQGRLIPGARIESLPFIEAVRQKRNAAGKDAMPDEVFNRLRGALFFGPAFRVTRNKLLFRDNLPEVLSTAVASDRNIEKRFKEWLGRCHGTLDKSIRFERLADSRAQAAMRAKLGEGCTVFERTTNGIRTVSVGDVVRIAAKPAVVGRVTCFTVPVAVREEGAYANGRVHIQQLPEEVHGTAAVKTFSMRRLECMLSAKQTEEHCQRETARLPTALRLEPMKFATGQVVELSAGDAVPETSVAVMNAGGQRLVRSFYNGEKQSLAVTQRLWLLPEAGAPLPDDGQSAAGEDSGGGEAVEGAERPAKRSRASRKGKKAPAEAPEAAAEGPDGAAVAAPAPAPELVVSVENKTPLKECFTFSRIARGLKRAGHYALEYVLSPAIAGQAPLRAVVPLHVTPGPAASLKVAGEGVAAVATRDIVLGEALPPFKITLADEFGNEVPLTDAVTAGGVQVYVAARAASGGADDGAMERCKGVAVAMEQEKEEGCMLLHRMQVLGSKKTAQTGAGLALFNQAEHASGSAAAPGQQASQPAAHAASALLCFNLQGAGKSLAVETVPIRLRPGAPNALRVVPRGPWEGTSAVVSCGEELNELTVQAVDTWGNPTAPAPGLSFSIAASCPGLSPAEKSFEMDPSGVTALEGLRAVRSGEQCLALTVGGTAENEALQAAADVALPGKELCLKLQVLPSALPSQAQIIYSGDPLAMSMADGDDGPTATAVLEGVEAGSSLGGLKLVLLDEAGAPAAMPVTGKVTVSWHRGHKKISWKGEPIKLPVVKVNDTVNEVATEWIRFQGDASNPITVECALEIRAVPGPPANWAVSLVDQGNSQAADEVGVVQCGRPFSLEIEALDRLNNRCRQDAGAALPEPQVVLQSEGGAPLEFDPGQWEKGWVAQQGNEALYCVRLTMSGPSGPVNITVKDEGGENGASLLGEDCLTVDLRPGPPTALAFEGPSLVQCGMRSALGTLRIGLRDASGFPSAATDSFEVTLASSALATNGSGRAAKVVASGGNKAKMVKGKHGATFSGVTVTAEAPGTYALRVQSTSRKVALEEGVLQVKMLPQSVATALQVVLPGDLAAGGCAAGSPARVLVAVETENGEQLPDDAVVVGLSLRLVPPGGGKSNAVLSTLLAEEDGSLPQEQGAYAFATPELTTAGAWTLTAEYTEPREELRATLGKHAQLRSTAVQLQVLPGAPVTATVQAKSLPDRLVVTNVAAEKQRLLVRNAAVQLEDAHGNAAQPEGCQVRFILRPVGPVGGGEPPVLQASEGPGPKLADELGRAFFGTLTVAEGSGCAPSGALECELVCEALGLYPSSAHDLEVDAEGWTVCWRCPVLFSDDVAQIAAVEKLNERRGALSERRSELQQRLNAAEEAAAAAEQQQQRAAQQADAERKRLPMDVPGTVKEAAKALKVLEKAQAGADDACAGEASRAPRWGPLKSPITAAVDYVIRSGDEGFVGVLAQLITIDDDRLARVAAAAMRTLLAVVVVKDADARARLVATLSAKKYPTPDVLALTHVAAYRGPKTGDIPGFTGAGETAQALVRAACAGSDPPLPLSLPHHKAGSRDKNLDWPQGCLGHLCNLVRPAQRGQRATVVYGLLSGTLVFETLNDALAYREHVTQTLRLPCGSEMVSLDMGRVSGRGIISGSNFRPPPLDKADFVMGSAPCGGSDGEGGRVEAMRGWIEVLREKEHAEAALADAQEKVAAEEACCRPELDDLEGQIAEVDAQIQCLRSPSGGTKQRRGGGGEAADGKEVAVENGEDEGNQGKGKAKRRRLVRGG